MHRSRAATMVFSDDGHCVADGRMMRRALEYVRSFDGVVSQHSQEPTLAGPQACCHEGETSGRLGLPGWPAVAEASVIARDALLAEHTRSRVHVAHVSTAEGLDVVRWAKARGIRMTAEVTPHHLALGTELLTGYDPVFKVNPPLREKADVEAVRQGLADGTLDAIATDHAPHAREDKEVEWAAAPPGMLGLQTALALSMTELVGQADPERSVQTGAGGDTRPGYLDLPTAIERLTAGPARCRRLPGHGGPVAPGAPANLAVFDPVAAWTVDRAKLASRARNTPFHGRQLRGRVVHTLLRGSFTVRDGQAQR